MCVLTCLSLSGARAAGKLPGRLQHVPRSGLACAAWYVAAQHVRAQFRTTLMHRLQLPCDTCSMRIGKGLAAPGPYDDI